MFETLDVHPSETLLLERRVSERRFSLLLQND